MVAGVLFYIPENHSLVTCPGGDVVFHGLESIPAPTSCVLLAPIGRSSGVRAHAATSLHAINFTLCIIRLSEKSRVGRWKNMSKEASTLLCEG